MTWLIDGDRKRMSLIENFLTSDRAVPMGHAIERTVPSCMYIAAGRVKESQPSSQDSSGNSEVRIMVT